jgi:hypothetical protein
MPAHAGNKSMFGFFKSTHQRNVERITNEVMEGFAKVCEAINTQRDMLIFFEGKRRRDFLVDPYFVRYTFGMFNAVTMIFEPRLRKKLGRGLVERFFVPYIKVELRLNEPTVRDILEKLFEVFGEEDHGDAAVADGSSDGAGILRGRLTARRLVDHFGFDRDAAVSPEQFEEFSAFRKRDRFEQQLPGHLSALSELGPFELKIKQAAAFKWTKKAEITKDGEDASWAKRCVQFIRGDEEAVLFHKNATITLVRDVSLDFDDFSELEEFIKEHPKEANDDEETEELRYLREMELFFIRRGYRDSMMHILATEYPFMEAYCNVFKAGYAARENCALVAALVLDAIQYYEQDRDYSLRRLTAIIEALRIGIDRSDD